MTDRSTELPGVDFARVYNLDHLVLAHGSM